MPEFGAWVFADTGGEIRNFVRVVNGSLALTRAHRADTREQLEFTTSLLSDMEKFLTYSFCGQLREFRGFPRLLVVPIPVTFDKVAPGFGVRHSAASGVELHRRGETAVRRGTEVGLVKFSHYVSLSPAEIRNSALDYEGKPHFMIERLPLWRGASVLDSDGDDRAG